MKRLFVTFFALNAISFQALLLPAAFGQVPSSVGNSTSNERLLPLVALHRQAVPMRNALPEIFDRNGHECRTLTGSVTLQGGPAVPMVFTRELDQKVRLDVGSPARSIAVSGLNIVEAASQRTQSGSGFQSVDDDILEALADDAPEAFLFSFGTSVRIEWIGERYRTDDGKSPGYDGPYYDIFARHPMETSKPGMEQRAKAFLFDSDTKMLSVTRYQIERNGGAIDVEVTFGGWRELSGQMVPATIVRSENGQQVFTISITAALSGATQSDSLFSL